MDRKTIGRKLAEIRERHGLTPTQLAKASHTHLPQIRSAEEGISYPRIDILEKWMKAYGMTLSSFFAEVQPNDPRPERPMTRGQMDLHEKLQNILELGGESAAWISGNIITFHRAYIPRRKKQD